MSIGLKHFTGYSKPASLDKIKIPPMCWSIKGIPMNSEAIIAPFQIFGGRMILHFRNFRNFIQLSN